MAALQKFNNFGFSCLKKLHDFTADDFRLVLTNIAPDPTDVDFAALGTAISSVGNGYPTGGGTLVVTMPAPVGAVAKVIIADYTFTAAVGNIGPFRYGAIYNNTGTAKSLVAWFDHGASVTLGDGETFKVDFDSANGAFTLA